MHLFTDMSRHWGLLSLLLLFVPSLHSQDRYLVHFDQKSATQFDANEYLDVHTIERRARLQLPAWDWHDLPVDTAYVRMLGQHVTDIRHVLRWFNGVSVQATATQIEQVARLPFVCGIEPLDAWQGSLSRHASPPPEGYDTLLSTQRAMMELDTLAAKGLAGQGVRIAIFDAGFQEANTHPALAHVMASERVLATYDFFDDQPDVYHHDRHGMEVMSCIAGKYGDRPIGAAPEASFLLARVEHGWREPAIEEDHWLAAVEWADQHGADLINSSLGYTNKRYTYADMDGKTAPVSRAAKIATEKGMLVINSAGNDGDGRWTYVGAPADVPEVLSVGGSLPMLEERIRFSSLGPNAVGVMKPDISAPGYVLSAWKKGRYRENAGTSFSAPLVTGVAACLLQQDSSLAPADLADRIRRGGHFYPYYDYELGYGVLKCSQLFPDSNELILPSFDFRMKEDSIILALNPYLMRDSSNFPFGRMLYYHLENDSGRLETSQQIRIPNKARFYLLRRRPTSEGKLRIWFAKYLIEIPIRPLEESKE